MIRPSAVVGSAVAGLPFPPRGGLLVAIGLAWALLVDLPTLAAKDVDPYTVVGDLAVGLLMQWTGVIAWRRSGNGRTGMLLYAAGMLWFVGSGVPEPLDWLTFPWRGWYEPLLVAAILGYPGGQLVRRSDQVIVGTLAAAYATRSVWRTVGLDPRAYFGPGAWENPTLLFWDERLWTLVEEAVVVIAAIVGLAVAVACVARWRQASGLARRTLAPVLASGLAIAPLLGWTALTTPTNVLGLALPDPTVIVWAQLLLRAVVPLAIVSGILRLQVARRSVADLLVELDTGVPTGRLEAVLRRHLGDPTVKLAFPRAQGRLVDSAGAPVDLPAAASRGAFTQIDDPAGKPIAYIVHDPALSEDPELVRAAGVAARLSLENERLQAEVLAQLLELRQLSARLVKASDAERRRVERDLHDGAQQRLVTLALRLRHARERSADLDPALAQMLENASSELDEALHDLRELARGIHPAALTQRGLVGPVTALAERATIPVEVDVSDIRCAPAIEITAYYVIAEALTNVARHASAAIVTVAAEVHDGQLVVNVRDDGVGGASVRAGEGLGGLRDRVIAVGGMIEVDSPQGEGTTVRVVLPCA